MADADRVILVVEDNPDDEAVTLRALKMNNIGNEIVVARDGAEALEYLHGTGVYLGRDIKRQPQVVLLDLKLPKLSGLQVLERIRAHATTGSLPVVVLTSSDEDQDLAMSYDLGANSYVRKPVDFKQFIEAVRNLGTYWTLINRHPQG